jgi:septal ring factor EnvC (AmiA/AmiB activator)
VYSFIATPFVTSFLEYTRNGVALHFRTFPLVDKLISNKSFHTDIKQLEKWKAQINSINSNDTNINAISKKLDTIIEKLKTEEPELKAKLGTLKQSLEMLKVKLGALNNKLKALQVHLTSK